MFEDKKLISLFRDQVHLYFRNFIFIFHKNVSLSVFKTKHIFFLSGSC